MADTNRYANGKIYRLVNNVDGEEYVGSTCRTLAKRKYDHKSHAKIETSRRVYKHLNEVGWENVSIVLVEEYPCENKMELERRERFWTEELKPSLNKVVPTRTAQEYRADNADKLKIKNATYRVENIDKERERNAKYYDENADKVREKKREYMRNKRKTEREAQQPS